MRHVYSQRLRCINLLEPFQEGKIILDGEEIGYHEVNGKRKRYSERIIARLYRTLS